MRRTEPPCVVHCPLVLFGTHDMYHRQPLVPPPSASILRCYLEDSILELE
eukprot:m.460078 g.460078  ORF g.460078 m.460078 type:complete len:50 (+) comp21589_c1_seq1:87-236(+)